MTEALKIAAGYVPFATFRSALEQLAKGVPSKLDRSVFSQHAWAVQTQLFGAFKFLGLMNADAVPTPTLDNLVQGDESERKKKFKIILEQRYYALFQLDLTKTTPHQLSAAMAEHYGVSGDTRDKAVRFFLTAAHYAAVPLSPLFVKGKNGSPSVSRKKKSAPKPKNEGSPVIPPGEAKNNPPLRNPGTTKTVSLKSGGELSVSATLDLFKLNGDDRKFVFELIDKLEAYESAT